MDMLTSRLLTYGVTVKPFQQYGVFDQYEKKEIPDEVLGKMSEEDLRLYVKGLYYSSCESAGDWARGHTLLKNLGFVEKTREVGHRSFTSLQWGEK